MSEKQAIHGQKLIRKYHRQLPPDLLQTALGSTLGSIGAPTVPAGAPPTEVPPDTCLLALKVALTEGEDGFSTPEREAALSTLAAAIERAAAYAAD